MSDPLPAGAAPLPSSLARRVDELCDRFEAAWKGTGARPRLEEYLADISGPERPTLLRELILLEADYRRLDGETPRPDDYLARFPELDPAWLAAALDRGSPQAAVNPAEAPTVVQPPPTSSGDRGATPELPTVVGGYRLVRPLGGGGMGTVYEAEEAATGRRVALKFLSPELAASADAIERFRTEGRLASVIAHPRCVFVLAADEDAGRPYIVMELMPGDTLADLVRRQGPLPPGQAVAHILDVIDGLLEAHRAGVIHRDVKPSNCFLTADGRVKVGDFGLAKSLDRGAHLTRTGTFLGTPLYASPEQIKGQPVDLRTDIYSVAATLYSLLAGQAPFEGTDPVAVMARVVSEPPPPLRGRRPEVPPGLERALLRGLERDRDRRPQSLDEFRAALLPFAPQQASAGTPGWRFAAHLLDAFLFTLLGTDIGLLALVGLSGAAAGPEAKQALFLVWNGLWIVAFTLLEGLWGWSPGKLLLGLRVASAGSTEPPGLARALVRTVAHFALVYLAGSVLLWMSYEDPQEWWLGLASALATVLGSLLLLTTMRKRNGYRGPHEFLSGTRVVRLPRPEADDLLAGRSARAPAGTARPPEAPKRLGPYTVQGVLRWPSYQKILIGIDPGLGRMVWLELRPCGSPALPHARRDLHRPTRLRWLGGGVNDPWEWDAFLMPSGVPAADLVAGGRRLGWHQARPVLEQLADELAAASADGTLPRILTVDQVWVRPGGQTLLLDAPPGEPQGAPAEVVPAADQARSLALLRQTAVLLLDRDEKPSFSPLGPVRRAGLWVVLLFLLGAAAWASLTGDAGAAWGLLLLGTLDALWLTMALRAQAAHNRKGLVRSPLPGYADALLARLLGARRPYATVEEVRAELEATRGRPPRVTPALRLVHLATLGALLAPGVFMMFFFSKSFNGLAIIVLEDEVASTEKALHILDSGRLRPFVHEHRGRDRIVQRFSDPAVRRRLADALEQYKEDLKRRLEAVNVVECLLLGEEVKEAQRLLEPGHAVDLTGFDLKDFLDAAHDAEMRARNPELFRVYYALDRQGSPLLAFTLAVLVFWPVCWVAWAFVWRGGLTQRALGLSLVLANGHRAWRLPCAWRALVVWGPVAALLGLSLWLDAYHPEQTRWSWACWGAALGALVGFAALALRTPARGLHDRLAGTYVVPR
jgi:hypothetical protein